MKMKVVQNLTKRLAAGLMVGVLAFAGIVVMPSDVKAAPNTDIKWEEYAADAFQECWKGAEKDNKAPVCKDAGYIFAGWYTTNSEGASNAIKPDVDPSTITQKVYAKFVPSYVLGAKVQNVFGVEKGSSSANVRLVSSVDCLDYKNVGFEVKLSNMNALTTGTTTKVYERLIVKESADTSTEIQANQLFGDESEYFITWTLTDIGSTYFGNIIYVRPFWTTYDGTKVVGLAKYAHVNDGIDKIVNIPINMYQADAIAAGVLEVTYPSDKLTYIGYETSGRLFPEGDAADKGSTGEPDTSMIKCVGNIEKIDKPISANTDIYMNLRFKVKQGATYETGKGKFLNFEVRAEDFCDNQEHKFESFDVWNIQY